MDRPFRQYRAMLTLTFHNDDSAAWTALSADWPDMSLLQSWAYGAAKRDTGPWQVERGSLADESGVVAVFQVLVRRLAVGSGLAWLNRGPLIHPDRMQDELVVGGVMAALRNHYAIERKLYLRIAPTATAETWSLASVQRLGYCDAGVSGWQSARLDLIPDEAVLRQGLKQKWRNILNKAERSEIDVVSGSDSDLLEAFYNEHDAFIEQAGFAATVTGAVLRSLNTYLAADSKLVAFRAQREGKTLGWCLIVRYGQTMEYLAGHAREEGRRVGAGQLLLWRAALHAKACGAIQFDLGGMDEKRTPAGIYRFKQGLGGTPYTLAPEIEALPEGIMAGSLARIVRWRVRRARAEV